MKKIFLISFICILLSGCVGCKSELKPTPKEAENPFPLTNQVQHIDGTDVKAPAW